MTLRFMVQTITAAGEGMVNVIFVRLADSGAALNTSYMTITMTHDESAPYRIGSEYTADIKGA